MPTARYRTRRRGAAGVMELDEWQEWALTSVGPSVGFAGWPEDAPDLWAEAWEAHGERLLTEFVEERPGHRPWAWWVFEHGQERPIVNAMSSEMEAGARRNHTHLGFLHSSILHGHGAPPGAMVPWQEPEVEYLDRLNLLTPRERKFLGL